MSDDYHHHRAVQVVLVPIPVPVPMESARPRSCAGQARSLPADPREAWRPARAIPGRGKAEALAPFLGLHATPRRDRARVHAA